MLEIHLNKQKEEVEDINMILHIHYLLAVDIKRISLVLIWRNLI